MKFALIIKANGEEIPVQPANGTDFSLEELQNIVGGYIETVMLPNGNLLVLNEEGKLEGLPLNTTATDLYNNPYDAIVGDVLVCDVDMMK
jgi:hypothetical protein